MAGDAHTPLPHPPSMMTPPPMLYSGYVAFTVPFAFAIGALVTRRLDAEWIRATRRFALIAWALLGFMAAGELNHPAVGRGIDYLVRQQGSDGFWHEPRYTATGFPRVFYLRYHGYSKFFPLWALARYRNLKSTNSDSRLVVFGM